MSICTNVYCTSFLLSSGGSLPHSFYVILYFNIFLFFYWSPKSLRLHAHPGVPDPEPNLTQPSPDASDLSVHHLQQVQWFFSSSLWPKHAQFGFWPWSSHVVVGESPRGTHSLPQGCMPSLYLHVAVHFLQSRALAVPARAVMKIIASLDSIV